MVCVSVGEVIVAPGVRRTVTVTVEVALDASDGSVSFEVELDASPPCAPVASMIDAALTGFVHERI